jgi:hypothetical protein
MTGYGTGLPYGVHMGRAWAWVKARPGPTIAFISAFLGGLLVGSGLGWRGFGHRTLDWGTASKWVPVGALGWGISQFYMERRDRYRFAQRLALGELRAALEASESTLRAIAAEIVTRAGSAVASAKPLDPTDPLVLSHREARRQVEVHVAELDDQTVADLAQAYLDATLPIATPSSTGGAALVTEIRGALSRRLALHEHLRDAIGVARKGLV